MWSLLLGKKPYRLSEINRLIIKRDRKPKPVSERPIVCIGLDGVVFYNMCLRDSFDLPASWAKDSVHIKYKNKKGLYNYEIILRPKLGELLIELNQHAIVVVYSSMHKEFIEAALKAINLKLLNAQNHQNNAEFIGIQDSYFWSKDQCIKKDDVFLKSLGAVNEYSLSNINDIWLIDDQPELVDFPSHVIEVSTFKGDPEDSELLRLMYQIFND